MVPVGPMGFCENGTGGLILELPNKLASVVFPENIRILCRLTEMSLSAWTFRGAQSSRLLAVGHQQTTSHNGPTLSVL